jgi:transcription elongation factor Elf1
MSNTSVEGVEFPRTFNCPECNKEHVSHLYFDLGAFLSWWRELVKPPILPAAEQVLDHVLAAHECGHAVCALVNGVEVCEIQNGIQNEDRDPFTKYNLSTFPPDPQVRKLVGIAGPVAEAAFLKQNGLICEKRVCSAGDAARVLGYREDGHDKGGVQEMIRVRRRYEEHAEVARLMASLDDHLMNGKDLPSEFQHLLGLIKQARETLRKHNALHDDLVAALLDKHGVLRERNIQRIWRRHSKPLAPPPGADFPAAHIPSPAAVTHVSTTDHRIRWLGPSQRSSPLLRHY